MKKLIFEQQTPLFQNDLFHKCMQHYSFIIFIIINHNNIIKIKVSQNILSIPHDNGKSPIDVRGGHLKYHTNITILYTTQISICRKDIMYTTKASIYHTDFNIMGRQIKYFTQLSKELYQVICDTTSKFVHKICTISCRHIQNNIKVYVNKYFESNTQNLKVARVFIFCKAH